MVRNRSSRSLHVSGVHSFFPAVTLGKGLRYQNGEEGPAPRDTPTGGPGAMFRVLCLNLVFIVVMVRVG